MSKEGESKSGLRRHLLKIAAPALLFPAVVVGAKGEDEDLFGIDGANFSAEEKTAATFLISAELLAITSFGYRLSDGTRTSLENISWKYGLPATNFAGASMLLAEMWK